MKQYRLFRAVVILGLLVLVGVVAWPATKYGYGFRGTLACMFTTGRNATRYAASYSENAFAHIRPGLTQEEVLRLVGQPLERVTYPPPWPQIDWKYSQAASRSGHFHLRTVSFTPDGKVSHVLRLFYFH